MHHLSGVPVREGGTQPAGTPLGPGFTVADGAHLIGAVFPNQADDGWRALLLVTGDPGAVLETYRRQAETARVPVRHEPICEQTAKASHCELDGVNADGTDVFHVTVWRGHVGDDNTPVSHAYVERSNIPAPPRPNAAPPIGGPISVPFPPLPDDWDLPDVGEQFAGGVRVEPDTELAAPVGVPRGIRRGFVGVLRVKASPVEVVRRYDRQWPNEGDSPDPEPWSDPDGAYVVGASGRQVGGEQFSIEVVTRPGHPTWAWVTTGSD